VLYAGPIIYFPRNMTCRAYAFLGHHLNCHIKVVTELPRDNNKRPAETPINCLNGAVILIPTSRYRKIIFHDFGQELLNYRGGNTGLMHDAIVHPDKRICFFVKLGNIC